MTSVTRRQPKKHAPMEFIGDMGRMLKDDLTTVYTETTQQSRKNKIVTALWGIALAGYTSLDDVPMGFLYGAVDKSAGTPTAVGAVTVLASGIAGGIGLKQRKRKMNRIRERGHEPIIENGSAIKDAINVYGVGVPATVLSYPRESVPTARRTALLALFYGGIGQGLSYAGFETAGSAVGVHPKAALALGIVGAGSYRYASAVREARSGSDDFESEPIEIDNIDQVMSSIEIGEPEFTQTEGAQ